MPTIEIPEAWLLFDPDGAIDGMIRSTNERGDIRATAEQAWAKLTPNKRTRDAEQRKGWTMRAGTLVEYRELIATLNHDKGGQW